MSFYEIPQDVESYRGCGKAFARIVDDKVNELVYLDSFTFNPEISELDPWVMVYAPLFKRHQDFLNPSPSVRVLKELKEKALESGYEKHKHDGRFAARHIYDVAKSLLQKEEKLQWSNFKKNAIYRLKSDSWEVVCGMASCYQLVPLYNV